jgi:hypothetical protein
VIREGHQLVVCADALKDSISGRIPDLPIKIAASKASRERLLNTHSTPEPAQLAMKPMH